MAAAGGAASIITQVQQTGPAPVNTLSGRSYCGYGGTEVLADYETDVNSDEHITLDLR
jgi:dipeptidyl-peptidase-3